MKLVDLNVLLYVVNRDAAHHRAALRWWETALSGDEAVALPWVVLLGFLRVATNPKIYPAPLDVDRAIATIETWLAHEIIHVVRERDDHWPTLRALVASSGAAGNLTTDAHLAALALTHGATLVTFDGDFSRFDGLRLENPLG